MFLLQASAPLLLDRHVVFPPPLFLTLRLVVRESDLCSAAIVVLIVYRLSES
jgi:hypothetical protein